MRLWDLLQDAPIQPLIVATAGVLFLFVLRLWLTWLRGAAGERPVRDVTRKRDLPALHDLCLRLKEGGATQIDRLICTPAALIVVETKNWSGPLFGTARDAYWTQMLAGGRHKGKVRNPLLQNRLHLGAVKELVAPGTKPESLVVTVGPPLFPQDVPEGVIAGADIANWLSRQASAPPVASVDQARARLMAVAESPAHAAAGRCTRRSSRRGARRDVTPGMSCGPTDRNRRAGDAPPRCLRRRSRRYFLIPKLLKRLLKRASWPPASFSLAD